MIRMRGSHIKALSVKTNFKEDINMKRIFAFALALLLAVGLIGCAKGNDSKTVRIGASPTPHKLILEFAAPLMEKKGYKLEITEYQDYVIPNTAVESGELDANFFQHQPYLTDFNEKNSTHIVAVAAVHYEPFGLYAGKTKSLDELKDGASIAIPNDGSNEARALYLLEQEGLIRLKEDAGFTATILDIAENPKNLDIIEVAAAQLPRSLEDVDFAVINGNYAIQAGLNASTDALAVESADGEAAKTYANILCVKEGNENNEAIKALAEILTGSDVAKYINDTFAGAVVPMS